MVRRSQWHRYVICTQSRPSALTYWLFLLGAETVSHIRENGRITVLFNAFEGPARIVRLYGKGLLIFSLYPPLPEEVE